MSFIPSLTLPSYVFSKPALSILLPVALGTGTGLFVQPRDTQKTYLALKQPPLRPPPYVFAPMWTILYGLMGYAANRAWTTGMSSMDPRVVEDCRRGATLYTVQLGLNLAWMPLFFGMGRPVEALLDIITLTGTVGYLAYVWRQVDEVATLCLVPYLGWLGFATYLCAGAGYLNGWNFKDKERSRSKKVGDPKGVEADPKTE